MPPQEDMNTPSTQSCIVTDCKPRKSTIFSFALTGKGASLLHVSQFTRVIQYIVQSGDQDRWTIIKGDPLAVKNHY